MRCCFPQPSPGEAGCSWLAQMYGLLGKKLAGWRGSKVVVNEVQSSWQPVTSAVPQGSVPRPACLTFFISDLVEGIECSPRTFADLLEGRKALQSHLDRQGQWAKSSRVALARLNGTCCTWVTTAPSSGIGLGKSGWKVVPQKRTWGCWPTAGSA